MNGGGFCLLVFGRLATLLRVLEENYETDN
jgi:hypothetical protein